jgi:hypothetical protein
MIPNSSTQRSFGTISIHGIGSCLRVARSGIAGIRNHAELARLVIETDSASGTSFGSQVQEA